VTLTAASPNGCIDSASIAIVYEEEVIFYVPNCFTPDGDMYNQTFQPVFTSGFDPFNFSLTIYNRWGQPVYDTTYYNNEWGGTKNDEDLKNKSTEELNNMLKELEI
jgi:gliding motility-associated-like protein